MSGIGDSCEIERDYGILRQVIKATLSKGKYAKLPV
jgi:hypothetical protein